MPAVQASPRPSRPAQPSAPQPMETAEALEANANPVEAMPDLVAPDVQQSEDDGAAPNGAPWMPRKTLPPYSGPSPFGLPPGPPEPRQR